MRRAEWRGPSRADRGACLQGSRSNGHAVSSGDRGCGRPAFTREAERNLLIDEAGRRPQRCVRGMCLRRITVGNRCGNAGPVPMAVGGALGRAAARPRSRLTAARRQLERNRTDRRARPPTMMTSVDATRQIVEYRTHVPCLQALAPLIAGVLSALQMDHALDRAPGLVHDHGGRS